MKNAPAIYTIQIYFSFIINMILAGSIGYTLAASFSPAESFSPATAFEQRRTVVLSSPKQSFLSQEPVNLSILKQADLFGVLQHKAQSAETPPDAPDTPLNLLLQGTLATQERHAAKAIIAGPDGNGKLYQIKDLLPSGAILHAIYPDRVILLRQNRYETLRLSPDKQDGPLNRPMPTASQSVGDLAKYKKQILENPSRLSEFVRLSPAKEDGRIIGYLLSPGEDPSLLDELDLQQGDIVTAVNGMRLDSPSQGLKVMQRLTTLNQAELEILRNGQILHRSFSTP